jgi:hypothetical protein
VVFSRIFVLYDGLDLFIGSLFGMSRVYLIFSFKSGVHVAICVCVCECVYIYIYIYLHIYTTPIQKFPDYFRHLS